MINDGTNKIKQLNDLEKQLLFKFVGNSIDEFCLPFMSNNQWYFQTKYCHHSISFCPIYFLSNGNLARVCLAVKTWFQGTNAQTSLSVAKKSFIINMRPGCRTSSPPSRVRSGPHDRDLQPPWPQARHRLVRPSPVQIWRRYINQNDIQQCVLASHLYHHLYSVYIYYYY